MTREDFISAWPSLSSPAARQSAFGAWMIQQQSSISNLLPPFSLSVNAGTASVVKTGTNSYTVSPTLFDDAGDLDAALFAGDYITFYALSEAEKAWYEQQKKIQKANEDQQKYLDKLWEKLVKDAKPKGSKSGYGNYLYTKLMKELEGGSG